MINSLYSFVMSECMAYQRNHFNTQFLCPIKLKQQLHSQESESELDSVIYNADSGVRSQSQPFEKTTPESGVGVVTF